MIPIKIRARRTLKQLLTTGCVEGDLPWGKAAILTENSPTPIHAHFCPLPCPVDLLADAGPAGGCCPLRPARYPIAASAATAIRDDGRRRRSPLPTAGCRDRLWGRGSRRPGALPQPENARDLGQCARAGSARRRGTGRLPARSRRQTRNQRRPQQNGIEHSEQHLADAVVAALRLRRALGQSGERPPVAQRSHGDARCHRAKRLPRCAPGLLQHPGGARRRRRGAGIGTGQQGESGGGRNPLSRRYRHTGRPTASADRLVAGGTQPHQGRRHAQERARYVGQRDGAGCRPATRARRPADHTARYRLRTRCRRTDCRSARTPPGPQGR